MISGESGDEITSASEDIESGRRPEVHESGHEHQRDRTSDDSSISVTNEPWGPESTQYDIVHQGAHDESETDDTADRLKWGPAFIAPNVKETNQDALQVVDLLFDSQGTISPKELAHLNDIIQEMQRTNKGGHIMFSEVLERLEKGPQKPSSRNWLRSAATRLFGSPNQQTTIPGKDDNRGDSSGHGHQSVGGDGVDTRGASRSRPRRTGRRFEQLGKVRREHVAWKRMGSTVRLLVSW